MNSKSNKHTFGITTLGEKGQVVIPANIRKSLGLKTGEKLLVFSKGADMLGLSKLSNLQKFASYLTSAKKIIKKSQNN